MDKTGGSDFRTVRGYQLASRGEGRLTPAMEDYLEMVFRLCGEEGYARIGRLSARLHVKAPSASRMVAKLAGLGYLDCDRYDIVRLTPRGRELGEYLLRRHRTLEAFLRFVGSDNPLEETELLEHTLGPVTVAAIGRLNDFFHGEPALRAQFYAFGRMPPAETPGAPAEE